MFVKISKSDVLQSIGFALTAAEEEYNRVATGVSDGLKAMLEDGETITLEAQEDATRALTARRKLVDDIKTLKHMAEFARDDDGVLLDLASYRLLEANLPAR
jgi:hypothetical protein